MTWLGVLPNPFSTEVCAAQEACLVLSGGGGGGGGGFFLSCEDLGRMFDHSFPACAFFFKVEISSLTLISLSYARISPQWLNELRRLWPNVP